MAVLKRKSLLITTCSQKDAFMDSIGCLNLPDCVFMLQQNNALLPLEDMYTYINTHPVCIDVQGDVHEVQTRSPVKQRLKQAGYTSVFKQTNILFMFLKLKFQMPLNVCACCQFWGLLALYALQKSVFQSLCCCKHITVGMAYNKPHNTEQYDCGCYLTRFTFPLDRIEKFLRFLLLLSQCSANNVV